MRDPRVAAARAIEAVVLLAMVGAPAQAGAQSLSAAFQAALRQDPEWQGARETATAAAEGDAQARALFRPKVGVTTGAGYGRTTVDVTLPPPIRDIDRLRLSGSTLDAIATVQQPLLNGQASAQARELRAGSKAGAAQLEVARQQLIVRVAESYFAVLQARDALASVRTQEASARREQQGAQARFDAGRARITDVREAQARADAAAAQAVDASAQLDAAVARFDELTGLDGTAVVPLRADVAPVPPAGALADWQRRGETSSPAVAAIAHAADAAEARVGEYGWRSRVRIDATGSAGRLWFPGSGNDFASVNGVGGYTVGLRLQAPLYSGGGLESQRRQAAAQARGAQDQLASARRDVRLAVQQAWSGQASGVAAVDALRTALASARLQERAAITGREVGIRTQSDVLMAQAQVVDTERRLNDAVRNYERSRLLLAQAAGTLSEQDLAVIDQDLAPH